jgi:hypothetical protein
MYRYHLAALGLLLALSAGAQTAWQSKGPLYQDKFITVEIEYQLGKDACQPGGSPSRYRYKITKLTAKRDYYINWRFDYFDCDHELKTQSNSLHITAASRTGYFSSEANTFFAKQMSNNFNDVKRSLTLPTVTDYEPTSPISMEPKMITGPLKIHYGEATTLSMAGGYLAQNAVWKWFEGDCSGKYIGSGTSITVHPTQNTTYAVRAEGKNLTNCVLVTVSVADVSLAASGIRGKSEICSGERDIPLFVSGGRLAGGAKWIWYADDCNGAKVGEGENIIVSPLTTTRYFVRAEGPEGKSMCQVHQVTVLARSRTPDLIDGPDQSVNGAPFILSVQGGFLAPGARWVWYEGTADNKITIGTGNTWTINQAYATQVYYVRAEGSCFTTDFVQKTVTIVPAKRQNTVSAKAASPSTFFINGGVITNDPDHLSSISNYMITIGGGKNIGWYLRAKISKSQASSDIAPDQISDLGGSGSYRYNGLFIKQHNAYSFGLYLGGKNLAVYLGGGYGQLIRLNGVDQFNSSNYLSDNSYWVKDPAGSLTGVEAEGGLLIKASIFNLMGGVSTIQGKYTDYHLGIGLNF